MKTHAIFFAGGINDFANYARYPEDFRVLLTALNGFPGLRADAITVFSGPGGGAFQFGNTAITGTLASRANLRNTILTLVAVAKPEDRFLFFASNHGGQRIQGQSSSTLYCWGGEVITPEDLAGWCAGIPCLLQAFVLGQCYAGGFIGALKTQNRAILTACTWNEVSWASSAMAARYDEFIYRVAEGLEARLPTLSALFTYAQQADREKETPQFDDTGGVGGVQLW